MNKNLFDKMTKLYTHLDERLLKLETNVCKECNCNECCTLPPKGYNHPVREIELEYIQHYYTDEQFPQANVEQFKEFLSIKKDPHGNLLHPTCPFWNQQSHACSIYASRPISCRLYGHYFVEGGSPPPDRCYFKNIGKYVTRTQLMQELPPILEFEELSMEYAGQFPVYCACGTPQPQTYGIHFSMESESNSNPIVEGQKLRANGKPMEALAKFKEAMELFPTYSVIPYLYAATLYGMAKYKEGAHSLEKALELNPNVSTYHSLLAITYENIGDYTRAIEEYEKAIQLNPQHAFAHAGIARIYRTPTNFSDLTSSQKNEQIQYHLRKAKEIDPECN